MPVNHGSNWSLFPLFVVRSAGFSFQLLNDLRLAEFVAAAETLAAAEQQISALKTKLLARADAAPSPTDPAMIAQARQLMKALRKQRPVPEAAGQWAEVWLELPGWAARWNQETAAAQESRVAATVGYSRGLEQSRRALQVLLALPQVREAIYLMTPEILDRSARHLLAQLPRTPGPNQDERKIAAFVQRLCAKCETNAFAGPIAYGGIGASYPEWLGEPTRQERRGFVAFWALRALVSAQMAAVEDFAEWQPRRGIGASLVDETSALTPVLRAVDGRCTWAEVARQAGVALPGPGAILRLDKAGVIWTAPLLPTSQPDALESLDDALVEVVLPQLPEVVQTLRALCRQFATGDVPEKTAASAAAEQVLQQHGVAEVRRGAGKFYADRTVLYEEDFDGSRSFLLPEPVAAGVMAALEPVLDIAAAASLHALAVVRDQTLRDFEAAFPGEAQVPFQRFITQLPLSRPFDLSASPVVTTLLELIATRWDGQALEVTLTPDEVRAAVKPYTPASDETVLASPDIFLLAPDEATLLAGHADIVIGEIHWGLQLFSNLCCFVEDQRGLVTAARNWLAQAPGAETLVNVALGDRFGKMCFLEICERTLELSGPARPGQPILQPADLLVDRTGALREAVTGTPVQLLSGDPQGRLHTPFAPPALHMPMFRRGDRMPRLRIGRVIVQRAVWWTSAEEFATLRELPPVQACCALVAWFRARQIPERVFVHLETETKPFYMDLGSPHLVDLLLHSVREGEVRLTELLPGPDALWLGGPAQPHVCEFRLGCVRIGSAEVSADQRYQMSVTKNRGKASGGEEEHLGLGGC